MQITIKQPQRTPDGLQVPEGLRKASLAANPQEGIIPSYREGPWGTGLHNRAQMVSQWRLRLESVAWPATQITENT